MFEFLFIVFPLIVGYLVGTWLENRHFADIRAREAALQNRVFTYTHNHVPAEMGACELRLLAGGTVVSVDAFKRLAAKVHSFFGGRVGVYESLVERARREAILRLREHAARIGAEMVLGIRIETSPINDGDPRKSMGVELVAYGTAVIPHKAGASAV